MRPCCSLFYEVDLHYLKLPCFLSSLASNPVRISWRFNLYWINLSKYAHFIHVWQDSTKQFCFHSLVFCRIKYKKIIISLIINSFIIYLTLLSKSCIILLIIMLDSHINYLTLPSLWRQCLMIRSIGPICWSERRMLSVSPHRKGIHFWSLQLICRPS